MELFNQTINFVSKQMFYNDINQLIANKNVKILAY